MASRAFGIESISTGCKEVTGLVDCAIENNPCDNAFCKGLRYDRNVMSTGNKEYPHSSYEGSHCVLIVISSLPFHTLARLPVLRRGI